ncbi:MAG: DNA-3-methyladenine glycosylase [Clostridiales bacterium]
MEKLLYDFFCRDTIVVAEALLGKILIYHSSDGDIGGRIIETEAYLGENDEACHTCRGKTPKNAAMFGTAGRNYLYRSYGIHLCYNITTDIPGMPSAVLLRSLEPLFGLEIMAKRRPKAEISRYCAGPGNLTKALGLDISLNDSSLLESDSLLAIYDDGYQAVEIVSKPRIGISKAQDLPLRFYLPGFSSLSRK